MNLPDVPISLSYNGQMRHIIAELPNRPKVSFRNLRLKPKHLYLPKTSQVLLTVTIMNCGRMKVRHSNGAKESGF